MPFVCLLVIIFFLFVMGVGILLEEGNPFGGLLVAAAFLLGGWAADAYRMPNEVEKEIIVKPNVSDIGNGVTVQTVTYASTNGRVNTVNINNYFKGQVAEKYKVKITTYKSGYYKGIDFLGIADKLELVE